MYRPLTVDSGIRPPSSRSGPSRRNDTSDSSSIEGALERKLERVLKTAKPLLEDAERKQFTNSDVGEWLVELRNSMYDAESALDFIRTVGLSSRAPEEEVPYHSCALLEFQRDLPSKVEKITDNLTDLILRINKVGLIEDCGADVLAPDPLRKNRVTSSLVHESDVLGREDEKEQIMKWVISDEESAAGSTFDVFSIVGMGGVGKTALAQLVYNDPRVLDRDFRLWVFVSDSFDAVQVTKEILESITEEPRVTDDLDELQYELCALLKERKFLVVLDDVWNSNSQVWERFMIPFSHGPRGSKVVITTRDNRVASAARSSHDLQLNQLSEDVGWSLFSRRPFPEGEASPRLVEIGREIVKKCNGLPLAIKAARGVLLSCGKDVKRWERVLQNNLWNKPQIEGDGNAASVLPAALAISYCYLPFHLKRCFSYCSLFPKGHIFRKKEMVMLWIDEGFVQKDDDIGSIEDTGDYYFDEMVSRSLLQLNRNQGSYLMHDLTHDFAGFVSRKLCKSLEGNKQIENCESIRHISFLKRQYHGFKDHENLSEIGSLQTLLSVGETVPRAFLEQIKNAASMVQQSSTVDFGWCKATIPNAFLQSDTLRKQVAHFMLTAKIGLQNRPLAPSRPLHRITKRSDLSEVGSSNRVPVSEDILHDISLRFLSLRVLSLDDCLMNNLPDTIGNLRLLRRLVVSSTNIKELPASICNLSNLRFISCNKCPGLQYLPDQIGNLVALQELDVSSTAIEELPASLCDLFNLEKLECKGCQQLGRLPDGIGDLASLQTLDLSGTSVVDKLPASLYVSTRWRMSDGIVSKIEP